MERDIVHDLCNDHAIKTEEQYIRILFEKKARAKNKKEIDIYDSKIYNEINRLYKESADHEQDRDVNEEYQKWLRGEERWWEDNDSLGG